MTRIIPNQESWIAFSPVAPVDLQSPLASEIAAAGVINLTRLVISINASSQGNTVPTPDLSTLFETSIPGTSSATFTGDFYRDDDPDDDLAWSTLFRGVSGVFYISRFGGTGTGHRPVATEPVEVWPIRVTSRSSAALSSNTAQMFTLTCAVPEEPAEDAVVAT